MNRLGAAFVSFALAWLMGYFVVALLWGKLPRSLNDRLFQACAAWGLGAGIIAALYFLWIAALGAATRGFVVFEAIAVIATGLAWWRYCGRIKADNPRKIEWGWVSALLALYFFIVAVGVISSLLLQNQGGVWDAFAIWNVHAKFLNAPGNGAWKAVFAPIMAPSHPDYPPLLPALVAQGWLYVGKSIPLVPVSVAFLFTVASFLLIASAVTHASSAAMGALACTVLATSSVFLGVAMSQYADMPLAFYFLLTVAFLHRADSSNSRPRGLYLLAGLSAGMAALTKNEGSLFLVALGGGRLVYLLRGGDFRRNFKALTWVLAGLAPLLFVLFLFKAHASASYLVAGQGKDMWHKLVSRERALLIIAKAREELEAPVTFSSSFVSLGVLRNWHLLATMSLFLPMGIDPARLQRSWTKAALASAVLGLLGDVLFMRVKTGGLDVHRSVLIGVCVLVVAFGFDYRRLLNSSTLSFIAMFCLMNGGYFVVYMLTPMDLQWQLSCSIERLFLHTIPLAIFIAFLTVVPQRDLASAGLPPAPQTLPP
jgi:hypothetical protein